MWQTNQPQCIATVRGLIEIQNQLKPLFIICNKFDELIFHSVKIPKIVLLDGLGSVFRALSSEKLNHAILHNRKFERLRTHTILVNIFFNYCHPYVQGNPTYKNIGTRRFLHCIPTLNWRIISHYLSMLLTAYATIQCGVWVHFSPF